MRPRRKSGGVRNAEHPYTYLMNETGKKDEQRTSEALEISGEECELCGAEMYGLHCKLICPNCGYRRDCSDP